VDGDRAAVTRPLRAVPFAVAAAVLAAFLAVFFVYPLVTVLARGASLTALADVAGDARLRGVAWFTLWQAAVSTALTIAIALPGAWALARYRFRGRALVWAAITVPFVLPTVVVASAFVALLGPGGPLARLDLHPGIGAVLAAHVFFNYAVVARTVGNALAHVDPRLDEAARMLGASRWRAFLHVDLPLIRPALAAASSIVFLFTFTSFGVVLLLGGIRRATIEVEIWRQTAFFLDLPTAAALAVIQLVAVVASLAVYGRLQERATPMQLRAAEEVARPAAAAGERAFVVANLVVMAVLLGGPIAVLVHRSLDTASGVGFGFYEALGTNPRGSALSVAPTEAIANSLTFAVVATAIALATGAVASAVLVYRRRRGTRVLDTVLMLPLGTSAVTLGLGFLLALDEPPLNLRDWPGLIPIVHSLVGLPFVVRIVVPALRSIDPRLREAAAVLGASPRRARWEVDVPLAARAFLVAAGFAFAVSLGEFGATVFLARFDNPTMPIAIARLLSQPGALNVGQAAAMSTLLMLLTAAVIGAIERLRVGSIGTF
jgi:thiamine transport system permease protein